MTIATRPHPAPARLPPEPTRAAGTELHRASLHLVTYVVGNAVAWTLWAALTVSADPWFWWLLVPTLGWALVLAAHLWSASRAR